MRHASGQTTGPWTKGKLRAHWAYCDGIHLPNSRGTDSTRIQQAPICRFMRTSRYLHTYIPTFIHAFIHACLLHIYTHMYLYIHIWQRLKNIGLVTGPGGLFAIRRVTESGGLATNPPCDMPIEDYCPLRRGPRQRFVTEGPRQRYVVCNRGGEDRDKHLFRVTAIYIYICIYIYTHTHAHLHTSTCALISLYTRM